MANLFGRSKSPLPTVTRRQRPSRTARGPVGGQSKGSRSVLAHPRLTPAPGPGINGGMHGTSASGRAKGANAGGGGSKAQSAAKITSPQRRQRFGQF